MRGRAEVARQAHNLEAVGSIPTPATKDFSGLSVTDGLFFASVLRSCVVIITAALQPFLSCFSGRFSPVFGGNVRKNVRKTYEKNVVFYETGLTSGQSLL